MRTLRIATEGTRRLLSAGGRFPTVLIGLVLGSVSAQAGLYGPEAPVDVAWVRALNASATGGISVRVADAGTVVLPYGGHSRYVKVAPGAISVAIGHREVVVEVESESFTTVVALPDRDVIVADPALRDVSRGLLGLLNLTGLAAIDLRVPDGTPVVTGVAPGHHDAIAVARATTELVVTIGDEAILHLEAWSFERGIAYVVVVFDTPDGLQARVLSSGAD